MSSSAHKHQAPPDRGADVYDDGHLRVEHNNYFVSCGGTEPELSRKEFLLVSALARRYGSAVPVADIWRHVWGEHVPFNRGRLRVQMHRLRRTLAPFGLRVVSEPGVGYALRGSASD